MPVISSGAAIVRVDHENPITLGGDVISVPADAEYVIGVCVGVAYDVTRDVLQPGDEVAIDLAIGELQPTDFGPNIYGIATTANLNWFKAKS